MNTYIFLLKNFFLLFNFNFICYYTFSFSISIFKKMGDKMKEYEKGIKVDDIQPYIEYCEKNGYKKVAVTEQNRKVFENKNDRKIISRITTEKHGDQEKIYLDFKNFSTHTDSLQISQESKELEITRQQIPIILSMLNTLNFEQSADNFRTRYVYKKGSVKFEIDDYKVPSMKVVALEGKDDDVERVFDEITKL